MKRNSLIKRIAVGIMAFSLIIPAVPAGAHLQYNPLATGNNGIYIDTSQLPPNDNNITYDSSTDRISARRNVSFQLDCSVDSSWAITAANGDNQAAADLRNNLVTINPNNGFVSIDPTASTANYLITASAYNVSEPDTDEIKLRVRGDEDAAVATSIKLNKKLMDVEGRVEVSEDGKTVTLTGNTGSPLSVIYEPDYLVDNGVTYTNMNQEIYNSGTVNNPIVTPNGVITGRISSLKASTGAKLKCTVGVNNATLADTQFTVKVVNEDYTQKLTTDDISMTSTINRSYSLKMNQDVTFYLDENTATALPLTAIRNVNWTITQNNVAINGVPNQIDDTVEYAINDAQGVQQGLIVIPNNLVNRRRIIKVLTNPNVTSTAIPAVSISGITKFIDDSESALDKITMSLNGNDKATFAKAKIDFDRAGLVEGTDYVVEDEIIEKKSEKVYYFESDGNNLNLANATFADVSGVRDYEASKNTVFGADGNTSYTVSYNLSNLAFGSTALNNNYNNNVIGANEVDGQNSLLRGDTLTKQGLGYKKLTVTCMQGATLKSQEYYIIRFVTPSANLANFGLAIDKDGREWYAANDTIHIRQGEAVVPGVFANGNGGRNDKDPNSVTVYNPYLEYEFTPVDSGVASATVSTATDSAGIYRVNGLKQGRVLVTLRGKVNKAASQSFVLYVNKDIYDTTFSINFDDARSGGIMNENYVVQGKYNNIPVGLTSTSANGGIPKVTWSLSCTSEFAVIDPETGVLTTKKSTGNSDPIVITATAPSGKKAEAEFTIAEVVGTKIKTIAETSDTKCIESADVNTGSCKAGDRFTLAASTYEPENATKLDGTVTWASDNPDVATIEATTGKVIAIGQGTTRISASYRPNDGTAAVVTYFTLNVTGVAKPITGITANDTVELTRIDDTASCNAKPVPADATDGRLKFESSDPTIATVDEAGQVTAISVGECTITITSVANPSITKIVTVKVGGNADKTVNENVAKTQELINAIGTVAADDASKAKIDAAKKAYDALTPEQKAQIPSDVVAKLTAAESAYTTAKAEADKKADEQKKEADKKASDPVVAAINALPATITTTDEAGITAARTAYDKLTEDQKKLVSADVLKKLTDAEAALAQEKAKEAAAQSIQTKTTKVKTAKNNKGKKVKVGFAKVEGANGYQVRYSLKKSMKSSKSKVVTGTSATLTKLKKKTYYIQVRAFSEYNGTKYYTKWSAKKPVKVKK